MSIELQSGEIGYGQNYNPSNDWVETFTEQLLDKAQAKALIGNNRTEVIPRDKLKAIVRVYSPPTAQIEAYSDIIDGTVNLQLPDELISIVVTFNKNELDGLATRNSGNATAVGPGSFSFSPRVTAQGSATIMPDVQIDIRQTWSQNAPVTHYGFYMLIGSSTAAILARLSTLAGASVTAWPTFRPVAHTLTLKGQQISLSQTAAIEERFWFQGESTYGYQNATETSYSKEGGVTIRSIRIPPTIHGLITISSATDGASVTTTVTSTVPAISSTVPDPDVNLLAITNNPSPITLIALASVSPTSLAATSPTAIPTSGLRLLDIAPTESKWGYVFLKATVFNFANLA